LPGIKIPDNSNNTREIKTDLANLVKIKSQNGKPLQEITETAIKKPIAEIKLPDIPKPEIPAREAEINTRQFILPRELFANIAGSLGHQPDFLNTSLLAFLRFFSLPAEQLGNLRRELLGHNKPSGDPKKDRAMLEGKAMAAVSAMDKGISLSPEALEYYAAFLNSQGSFKGDDNTQEDSKEESPKAEELKSIANEEGQKDDFLDLINRLPGMNDQYWYVLPLNLSVKNTKLEIILRLLIKTGNEREILIADINTEKKQWRFFLKKGEDIVHIRINPPLHEKSLKKLEKKAEKIFNLRTQIENSEDIQSWMDEIFNEPLPLVNKEV